MEAKDLLLLAKEFRTDINKEISGLTGAEEKFTTLRSGYSQRSGAGDLAMVNAFQKLIDDGAVVRDSDVRLIQSAQSIWDRIATWQKQAKEGELLPQSLRDEMLSTAQGLMNGVRGVRGSRVKEITSLAQQNEIPLKQIISQSNVQKFGITLPDKITRQDIVDTMAANGMSEEEVYPALARKYGTSVGDIKRRVQDMDKPLSFFERFGSSKGGL